eukprot:6479356-Amphidinium_carterae.1
MIDYEQIQAQLRKGDPIQVGQLQPPGSIIPPLLSSLTQGREDHRGYCLYSEERGQPQSARDADSEEHVFLNCLDVATRTP